MSRAKELDDVFASSGPVGPLHGLPISLKDQYAFSSFTVKQFCVEISNKLEDSTSQIEKTTWA